ncbi:MAG: hypothetical protein II566_08030, partial [Lachnospiraceae bacterium]|nr:hypothetical protein [Lachnospiraceae bacterium]
MQEKREITITCQDRQIQVPYGTTLQELAKELYPKDYKRYYLAEYNGKLAELHRTIKREGSICFLDGTNKDSQRAYRRSLVFLMQRALKDLLDKVDWDVRVQFSLGDGYYCTLKGHDHISDSFLSKLSLRMEELIQKDLPIEKNIFPTCDAIALFAE